MTFWIVLLVVLLVIFAFMQGRNNINTDVVMKIQQQTQNQYEERLKKAYAQVEQKDKELRTITIRYNKLMDRLREVANAKDKVELPKTSADTEQRFTDLGYKPIRK